MMASTSRRAGAGLAGPIQWAIFGLALSLRAGLVLAQHVWHLFFGGALGPGDQRIYASLAEHIASGQGMIVGASAAIGEAVSGFPFAPGPTAWVTPGYPLFLAGCRLVFGPGVLAVELVQCVLGAGTAVLLARMTAQVFGPRAGVIGGVIAACYFELVLSAFGLATEPLYIFVLAAALLATVRAIPADRLTGYAASGALFGLAALVRPTAFPEALGLGCVLCVCGVRRSGWSRVWPGAVFAGACVLVLLPWGIRNYAVMGRFMLMSSEGGYVLWLGNNPEYDRMASDLGRFGGYGPVASFGPVLGRLPEASGLPEVELGSVYRAAAIRHIVAYPERVPQRVFHKMWNMWRPVHSTASWRQRAAAFVSYPLLVLMAGAGFLLSIRRRAAWPLLAFVTLSLLLLAASIGAIRYRVPLWTGLIPLASGAVDAAGAAWGQRGRRLQAEGVVTGVRC
jgi:4-amino-4-deoxy-L-arabinose transferase-like glycosyltransferase